ncbi:MAG: sigma-70 family RNA polymerase sigma factor [Opitutaceae bacterium]
MRHVPGNTLLTRPTLLCRVRDWSDRVSWEEFHQLYRGLVYGRARRAGLSHADAEDVAQEVFKRVAETINDFDLDPARGSFRGWLMQLTRWRIADKREGLRREPPRHSPPPQLSARTATIERLPAPLPEDDEWDREWREQILALATDRLAHKVKPRHLQAFDLHVHQHWPVLRIAAELHLNPATIYVIAHRLTKQLSAEVAKIEKQLV